MAKAHYGSIYNLYGLCGPGTYMLLGPTEAGKSWMIKQLYFYATTKMCPKERRIHFETVICLSTTSTINKDYDWNENIIHLQPSNDVIREIIKERKNEMIDACKELKIPKSEAEEWATDHPMLIMMDDTYGNVDFTTPGNPGSSLATKARHYGIWFVCAVQYVHQVGPVFHDNARCWICFSTNAKDHKKIVDLHHGINKELVKICSRHNKKAHHIVVYITTWRFRKFYGVKANRILLLFPIPSVDTDLKKKQEIKERYKQLQENSDDSENEDLFNHMIHQSVEKK